MAMISYIALLRAVNVGGTGSLPMTEFRSMCESVGYGRVETYIASGNVVFETDRRAEQIKQELESRLLAYAGKPVGVMVRTAQEMTAVLDANPFPSAPPHHCHAIFLDHRPPADALDRAAGRIDEELRLGAREIFVLYPSGARRSKLRIPAATMGTARNMNTVAKLVAIASKP